MSSKTKAPEQRQDGNHDENAGSLPVDTNNAGVDGAAELPSASEAEKDSQMIEDNSDMPTDHESSKRSQNPFSGNGVATSSTTGPMEAAVIHDPLQSPTEAGEEHTETDQGIHDKLDNGNLGHHNDEAQSERSNRGINERLYRHHWYNRDGSHDTDVMANIHQPIAAQARLGVVQPGAVSVPGMAARITSSSSSSSSSSSASNEEVANAPRGRPDGNAEQQVAVDAEAYLVDEETDRLKYQNELILSATTATVDRRGRTMLFPVVVFALLIVSGLVVGLSVGLTNRSAGTDTDESLLAALDFTYLQGPENLHIDVHAEIRSTGLFKGKLSSGAFNQVKCTPVPCLEDPTVCDFSPYVNHEAGCCLMNSTDCTGPPCGVFCPINACFRTNPADEDCTTSDCYTCNQIDGKDIYAVHDFAIDIDCLHAGTSIRPENGQEYRWAIYCGPVVSGAVESLNYADGEYICGAFRVGGGLRDDIDGLISYALFPCQLISLAECGCAPSDVHFASVDILPDLPPPTGPCLPGGDCPFLCSDAGQQHARNLCHAFPGDIKWFEGENVLKASTFLPFELQGGFELNIYIKE